MGTTPKHGQKKPHSKIVLLPCAGHTPKTMDCAMKVDQDYGKAGPHPKRTKGRAGNKLARKAADGESSNAMDPPVRHGDVG